MTVSLTLMLIGTDEKPRWVVDIRAGGRNAPHWNRCCENGHYTPEAATAHGAELGAAMVNHYARGLQPPAVGALAIQKLEAAA